MISFLSNFLCKISNRQINNNGNKNIKLYINNNIEKYIYAYKNIYTINNCDDKNEYKNSDVENINTDNKIENNNIYNKIDTFNELYNNGWLYKIYKIPKQYANEDFLTGIFSSKYILNKYIHVLIKDINNISNKNETDNKNDINIINDINVLNCLLIGNNNSLIKGFEYGFNNNIYLKYKIIDFKDKEENKNISEKYNEFINLNSLEKFKNSIEPIDFYISNIDLDNKYLYHHFYLLIMKIKINGIVFIQINNIEIDNVILNILVLFSTYFKNIKIFKTPWGTSYKFYLYMIKSKNIDNINYLRYKSFIYDLQKNKDINLYDKTLLEKIDINYMTKKLSQLQNCKLDLDNEMCNELVYNTLFD